MELSKEELERKKKLMEWYKWRWEFARRNPKLREAYKVALELRKRAEHQPVRKIGPFIEYPYLSTSEAEIEREHCEKLGLYSQCLIDPNKSFDEILNGPECMEKTAFLPTVFWKHYAKRTLEGSHLKLDIDLAKVRSGGALKSEIAALIELCYEEYYKKYLKKHYAPEAVERRLTDYDLILAVGHRIENEALGYKQVAAELTPDEFERNPESAERNIGKYYERYKELVNGGYRDLTYP